MKKIAELRGHTSRVLHLALSPDCTTVASAAADETLRFWKVFQAPHSNNHNIGTGCNGPMYNMINGSCNGGDSLVSVSGGSQKILSSSSSVLGTGMNLR